jgi:hypothetical protein
MNVLIKLFVLKETRSAAFFLINFLSDMFDIADNIFDKIFNFKVKKSIFISFVWQVVISFNDGIQV